MTFQVAIVILASITVILLGVGLTMKTERQIMLRRVRRYGYEEASQAPVLADDLVPSFSDRVLRPGLGRVGTMLNEMTPGRSADVIRRRLDSAGRPFGLTPQEFSALKTITLFVGLLAGIGVGLATQLQFLQKVTMTLGFAFTGFYAPERWLSQKIAWRKNEIQRALPNAIDLLNVSIEAGLGFDASISKIVDKTPGPLSEELRRVLQEMAMGKARVDALRDFAAKCDVPEIGGFVAAVYQAEELGASMVKVLHAQAEMIRSRRRMRARETAARLPVKLLFPLIFFIFPSIFIVVLGPGAIQIFRTLLAK